MVHGLEAEYADQMNFVYLDVDDPNTLRFKESLGYSYQPHLFLVDGQGNVLQQWVGFVSAETLELAIGAALSN